MMKLYKKMTIVILTMIMLFSFALSPISMANSVIDDSTDTDEKAVGISLRGIVDGIFGIAAYPFKLVFLVPGIAANTILSQIGSIGNDGDTALSKMEYVSIEDILFNELALIDVNIFSTTRSASGKIVSPMIQQIRESIAGWYYAFRNLAIVASLLALVYIGIRMGLESMAEEKAKYKQMLTHWLVRICYNIYSALFYSFCGKCKYFLSKYN